jgi:excisionase family DNA binding protein
MMSVPFVPIEQVAKHFTVSLSTVLAWVRQGKIPPNTYIKVGNTYRFNVADVESALVGASRQEAMYATEKPDTLYEQLELDLDEDA